MKRFAILFFAIIGISFAASAETMREAIANGELTEEDKAYWQGFTVTGRPRCLSFNNPEFFDKYNRATWVVEQNGFNDYIENDDPYIARWVKAGGILLFMHQDYQRWAPSFLPDELAIEAPFFGKNVQTMLKLGRAQGVAMAAAMSRQVPITEYAPTKIKMAITGNGSAGKEQGADMLRRMLHIDKEEMPHFLDATDALGAAYCHYLQMGRPSVDKGCSSWKEFMAKNPDRVKRG